MLLVKLYLKNEAAFCKLVVVMQGGFYKRGRTVFVLAGARATAVRYVNIPLVPSVCRSTERATVSTPITSGMPCVPCMRRVLTVLFCPSEIG